MAAMTLTVLHAGLNSLSPPVHNILTGAIS